jgi:hypothetical protein
LLSVEISNICKIKGISKSFRRPMLYPIELQAQNVVIKELIFTGFLAVIINNTLLQKPIHSSAYQVEL